MSLLLLFGDAGIVPPIPLDSLSSSGGESMIAQSGGEESRSSLGGQSLRSSSGGEPSQTSGGGFETL